MRTQILANNQEAVRRSEEVSNGWGCATESVNFLPCHLLLLDLLFDGSPVTRENAIRLCDPSGQRCAQLLVSANSIDLIG
jgi:hypothetical protein